MHVVFCGYASIVYFIKDMWPTQQLHFKRRYILLKENGKFSTLPAYLALNAGRNWRETYVSTSLSKFSHVFFTLTCFLKKVLCSVKMKSEELITRRTDPSWYRIRTWCDKLIIPSKRKLNLLISEKYTVLVFLFLKILMKSMVFCGIFLTMLCYYWRRGSDVAICWVIQICCKPII